MRNLRTEEEIIASWKGDINKPVVSIACVTYNQESYIEDALEGFLIQETKFPFEIIIHDDASTDRTAEIIKEYESRYPRIIKPIYQVENQYSQSKSVTNFTIELAKADYIAICEGDDYWISKNHLQDGVKVFNEKRNISIYGSAAFIKKENTLKIYPAKRTCYDLKTYIIESPFVATASLIVNKKIWNDILEVPILGGRYFSGDTRLKLISLTKGNMALGSKPAVVYRSGAINSWSNRAIDEQVVIREMLDNLAMIREVGYFSDYSDVESLFIRIEDEVFRRGSKLAGLKGFIPWLKFIVLHLGSLSPRNIRSVFAANSLIKSLKNKFKIK